MADTIASLGIEVTQKGVKEAQESLGKLGVQAGAAEKAVKKYKQETQSNTQAQKQYAAQQDKATAAVSRAEQVHKSARGGFRAMRGATQQLSFQLQDIAVQAQMGTDGLRILSQQGPQILSIFGPAGAVTGALIAFGALFASVLIPGIEEAEEEIDNLGDALDRLASISDRTKGGLFALGQEFSELAKRSKSLAEIELTVSMTKARRAIEQEMGKIESALNIDDVLDFDITVLERYNDKLDGVARSVNDSNADFLILSQRIRAVSQSIGLTNRDTSDLLIAFKRFRDERTPDSFEDLNSVLQRVQSTATDQDKLVDFLEIFSDSSRAIYQATDALQDFEQAQAQLATGRPIRSVVEIDAGTDAFAAYQRNFDQIRNLEISADERFFRGLQARRDALKAQLGGQTIDYTMYSMGISEIDDAAARRMDTILQKQFKSATDALEKEFKANAALAAKKEKLKQEELQKARETQDLLAQLYSEADPEVKAFENKQNIISDKLRERLDAGKLDITEYYRALAQLEQNYTDFILQKQDERALNELEAQQRQQEQAAQAIYNQMTLMEKYVLHTQEAINNIELMQVQLASSFENNLGNAIEGLLTGTKSFTEAFRGMAQAILQEFLGMVAQMIAKRIALAVFGSSMEAAAASKLAAYQAALSQAKVTEAGLNAYVATLAIPVTGPALAPAAAAAAMAAAQAMAAANTTANIAAAAIGSAPVGKAVGGQVLGGQTYLVGERGPELLTMGGTGRVSSNDQLKQAIGGGESIQIVNNIDARGAGPDVDNKIRQAMKETSAITMANVQDLMRRRRFA